MSQRLPNPEQLYARFSQIFLFAEHLNGRVARHLRRSPDKDVLPSFPSVLLETRRFLARNLLEWPRESSIVDLAIRAGLAPPPNPEVIDEVTELLLRPARIEKNEEDWRLLEKAPNIAEVNPPDRLTEDLWCYSFGWATGFATDDIFPASGVKVRGVSSSYYWEEEIDPILLIQTYLLDHLGIDEFESANSWIQRWIRHEFRLRYTMDDKYAVTAIARRLNTLFFGKPLPTITDLHTLRSTTISTTILLREVTSILAGEDRRPANVNETGRDPDYLLQSLGVYLFLRFCRVLRVRSHWLASPEAEGASEEPNNFPDTNQQCVSALRAAESSFLLTRMFGSISSIPGLNFIFRGGIMPRINSGRTFLVTGPPGMGKTVLALQKLAGVAARGGLAVYFSFEENYELIVDRLLTFGLSDHTRFHVATSVSGMKLEEHLRLISEEHPDKGLLYLYTAPSSSDFSVSGVIAEIARVVDELVRSGKNKWQWKALTIDSVNALDVGGEDDLAARRSLQDLVDSVEFNRFLGILISEPSGFVYSTLSYLADTIIELGHQGEDRIRWLEIKKCRSQNYHPGRHHYQLQEGRGMRIFPSLGSLLSTLRHRNKSTLSEGRYIPVPVEVGGAEVAPREQLIAEKSSTLIYGPANSGKTDIAFKIALNAMRLRYGATRRPSSLLVISFRTTERNFEQDLRADSELHAIWSRLKYKKVRWYSPGANIAGEHILADLRNRIKECRRRGVPLERIIFDELESAEHVLPVLKSEPLFWSTLIQLVGTEAITSVFVFGDGHEDSMAFKALKLEVDYVFKAVGSARTDERLEVEKYPDLMPPNRDDSEEEKPAHWPLVLQVNGKRRGAIEIDSSIQDEDTLKALALSAEAVQRHLSGRVVQKVFVVPGPGRKGYLINIVV